VLKVYDENGFKFIHCNPDKSPKKSWRDSNNHLTLEVAEKLQRTGEMIGAIIPDDIIVIDLDRHEGKPDGVKTFRDIKEEYSIDFDITSNTFCVQTGGGGYHIFFYTGKNHSLTQGEKAPGIDIKTGAGYVIASGSPGYSLHPSVIEMDIAEIPENLKLWLETVNKKQTKKENKKELKKPTANNIPLDLLKKILKKLDVKDFDSNDKWYDLIVSAIAAAGDNDLVIEALSDWSQQDNNYSDAIERIKSFKKDGDITTGTFVHILREYGITQYFIKKVLSYNTSIELYENMRDDGSVLPFPEPDYDSISDSKEASELFITGGNSVAATLLGYSIQGHIIYCAADKAFYFFDGNKWSEFYDMFSVSYTVLIRLTKFMYAKKGGSDIDNENFIKLVKTINKTHWKRETINELQCREGVFKKKATWDSERLKETLTTLDGVIDFTGKEIIVRKGLKEEYRKSFVNYKCDEIMNCNYPMNYNNFLAGLFPDEDTLFTARQASCMYISGNAKKVFQIFHGGGDNGKSTWLEIENELLCEKSHIYPTSIIVNSKYGDDNLPPEAADFMGKYLLYGSEVQKGKQLSLGKIKNLTGDDTIAASPKYKDQRSFRPTWQMILSVNDLPFFDGADRAFINRLLILPFEKTFVNTIEEKESLINKGINESLIGLKIDGNKLKEDIRKEFPGIIYQKIADYIKLKHEYGGIIKQSKKCIAHKDSYISENNDIENFIDEMCVINMTDDIYVTSSDIVNSYHEYHGDEKMSASYIIRTIMKTRQEIIKGTKVVLEEIKKKWSTDLPETKKVQRRVLLNIRLKTIEELENEGLIEKGEPSDDEIPF